MISLLIIIYVIFISLGLPDSILGSSWPVIRLSYAVPLGYAGFVSMTITGCTIISSFFSSFLIKKIGSGKLVLISIFMTSIALFLFSISPSFIFLIIFAIPLGLGGGAIDSAVNEFVAEHYKAKHMNWLHGFWGIGALLSPIIISFFLRQNNYWKGGYRFIAVIQAILAFIVLFTLPLWKKIENQKNLNKSSCDIDDTEKSKKLNFSSIFTLEGLGFILLSFLLYTGTEATIGLWGASFLVDFKGFEKATAASWVSLFYGGITAGRLLSGFLSIKFNNKTMIRFGQVLLFVGILFIFIPLNNSFSFFGFLFLGLGCAPIFPALLHETPKKFDKSISQAIMGFQMSFSYIGSTFLPPIFGLTASKTNIKIFPYVILLFIIVMTIATEVTNAIYKKKNDNIIK